jgi:hypothetical protein
MQVAVEENRSPGVGDQAAGELVSSLQADNRNRVRHGGAPSVKRRDRGDEIE